MKKVIKYTIVIFSLLGIFVYWLAHEGRKDSERWELKIERAEVYEQEKKEYMSKIDQVGLFGIFLRGHVTFWLKDSAKNDVGIYKGKKFQGWDESTHYLHKEFSIQISPTVKNQNFIDYYISYDPLSGATYKIIGVLPKKFIDFVPESSRDVGRLPSELASQYYQKCEDYLKPIIEVISDGIKYKTDLLPVPIDNSKNQIKRISIKYKMNSGIEYIWGDNDSLTEYFDKVPEKYYGIYDDKVFFSNESWKDYKATVLELVGHCNAYGHEENLYVSLTHKIIENWVVSKVAPVYWKKVKKQKISKEEKELQKKKLSIDTTGLQ